MSCSKTPVEDCEAILAQFRLDSFNLFIFNVQLAEKFPLDSIDSKLKELLNQDDCFVLLGDFTNLQNVPTNSFKKIGALEAILPLNTNTSLDSKFKHSDNIFVGCNSKLLLNGMWGVVKQGLTHLAIPNGWTWGGAVSTHCPLWIEIINNILKDIEL